MPTISDPSTPTEYGPLPKLGVHPEASGFTATCKCQWLRFEPFESNAHAALTAHEKTCKAKRGDVDV